jgi:apolipoprotein N-acyltransferase
VGPGTIHRRHVAAWAGLSGLLWACAWPGIGNLAPLALIAWVPLLHAEVLHDRRTQGRRRSFLPYVLLTTLVWNASTSWWFFGVSEPLATRLISGLSPMLVNSLLMLLPWWIKRIVRRVLGEGWSLVAVVLAWTAFEHLHHLWDLKWPWFTMGNVFGGMPYLVQWYEWTGVLGGSLWLWVVTCWAHRCIVHPAPVRPFRQRGPWPIGLALVLVPVALSLVRFFTYTEQGPEVEVVIVQPNIDPYDQKFHSDPLVQLDTMLALAERAMTPRTRLVVMPETALQEEATIDLGRARPELHGLWENDLGRSESAARLRAFQAEHPGVALLTGMSSARLFLPGEDLPVTARPIEGTGYWYEAYNAALFIAADGAIHPYNKSKLVAGVEMMPFESVLGKLSALSVDLGGVSGSLGTQEERTVFRDPSSGIALVPAICYESVFGAHVAAHVRNGANAIAIITNDGWWGDSPGPVQHLTFASLRAIEQRRSIARSANTGISCWVDQRGVVHDATAWWTATALRAELVLNERTTFYARTGDLLGELSAGAMLLLLIGAALKARVDRKRTPARVA